MLGASLGLFKASCCLLGPFLGRSWAPFSPLGGSLGRPAASWAFPGRSWGPIWGSPGGPFGAFWASWRLPRPPREPRRQEKAPKPQKNTKSIVKYVVSFKKSAFSLGFYKPPGVDFSRFSSPRKLKKHVFYEGFVVFAVYRAGPEKGPKKAKRDPRPGPKTERSFHAPGRSPSALPLFSLRQYTQLQSGQVPLSVTRGIFWPAGPVSPCTPSI